jgi:hypothetical protein
MSGLMLAPFGLGDYRYLFFACGILMVVGVLDDYESFDYPDNLQGLFSGQSVSGTSVEIHILGKPIDVG